MRLALLMAAALLLAGCTANAPRLDGPNPLAAPPWEAFVRAGPDAYKDIDYETLNGPTIATAQPTDLKIDTDIAVAELGKAKAKPNTPAPKGAEVIKAVAVLPVKGSGSKDLTAAMRAAFETAGWPVIASKRKDAITIQGTVKVTDTAAGSQRVSLLWLVSTPKGKRLGDVKQENDVPAGSLDQGWGDNADAAAQAAAEGIAKLIEGYR